MAGHEKTEIRTQLHSFLVKKHTLVPAYIRNKVCSSNIPINYNKSENITIFLQSTAIKSITLYHFFFKGNKTSS